MENYINKKFVISEHIGNGKFGEVYKGNVIANDILNDLALIKSNYKPNVIFPLSDKNPSLLQDIYVAGFPFGNAISRTSCTSHGQLRRSDPALDHRRETAFCRLQHQ